MTPHSFTENGARRIVDAVRRVESWPQDLTGGDGELTRRNLPQAWWNGYNNASATIPAYSVVVVGTVSTVDGVPCAALTQANTTFSRSLAISPTADVAYGGGYQARCAYGLEAGLLKYGDSSVVAGDTIGAKPSNWTAWKNYPGFRVVQVIDSSAKIALVVPEPPPFYLCKADSAISKGSTGTASLWIGASGSEADSTVNITSCSAKWMAIATSKWCGVSFVNGVPYITQLEC